jgi:serine/threonine protein kinase/Tfp pilus assembly protein PilF
MHQLDEIPEASIIGRRIGVYRLDEEIGRGGMGAVYRATRVDGEFDQTVAIKLIKRGMDTDLILKRFRRERQILAALNHPNIASFLGGGSTEDGLPYFVMEFISGRPLYEFCDENKLGIKDRLRIFREICYAVIAAHRTQIIHRDIKPSNILVRSDRKPKLLDFGIAKVLDPDLAATDYEPTATQMRVMTPEYASPEQINGESIGAASDVYSLGVILYELLTGHRPYSLRRQVPGEAARVIREEDPTNPSGSLTRDENLMSTGSGEMGLEAILESRNTSLEALRRELAGDLDKIVLKTLRKEPENRYETAADLANDITNYLEGRPVKAEFHVTMRNLPRTSSGGTTSVAVLPFKVIGSSKPGETGEEFLGIGLADALISRLSGIQRLIVRPTSSVLPFGEGNPIETGRYLGVNFVLDGNVRRAANRIRISVQLLDITNGSTRWAKAFDEDVTDVLDLEDNISAQVATSLLPQLTSEERRRLAKRGTNKPEAYTTYLRGRYFVNRFTDESLLKAVDAFNEAISIDPNYALPYVGLADFYIWSAIFGEIPSIVGFTKAQEAIRRALEIDDSFGEAYAVLAFCVFLSDWNWLDAEYFVNRAIELAPNYSFVHECLSNFLCAQGRFEEAIYEIERAEELDPVSPRAKLMTAWTYYNCRRTDDSVEKARNVSRMQDDFPQALLHLGNALISAGEYDEAISSLRASIRLWKNSGMPRYILCFALAAKGRMDEAQEILDELLSIPEMKPYFIAMAYVAVGEIDKAFEWFEKAIEAKNEWMIWFAVEPKLDSIRGDKRYKAILRKLRNPLAEKDSGSFGTRQDTGEREKSIAVLPFKLIGIHDSSTAGEEFLSIGLADALTMRLSNIGRFLVRPTSSVLPFSTGETDPFAAGRELGVEFVLDGNIRHIGDRIRVTTQLLDISESGTRWAASFDEKYTDVLELEDIISERVTHSLLPRLTGDEEKKLSKRGTDNPAAHEAYLQGRFFWNQFTPASFPKAFEAFSRAVELDPEYALAYVGIADYYTWASIYGILPQADALPHVSELASRALELDNGLSEAHAAIGLYNSNKQNWSAAETSYRRAVELNPNYPLAHEWLSALLVGTGRFEEGTGEILLAEELDPISLRPKVLSAWTLYQTRNYSLALEKAREVVALDPDFMQGHLQMSNILTETGDHKGALIACQQAVALSGGSPMPLYLLAFALARSGEIGEAKDIAHGLAAAASSAYVSPYFVAMSMFAAGDADSGFDWLGKAQEERSAWLLWLGTEPKLDGIRKNERYWKMLEATGNPIINVLKRSK